jgi:hypothetical protein
MIPVAAVDQCRMSVRCTGVAEVAKIEKIAHVEPPNIGKMR